MTLTVCSFIAILSLSVFASATATSGRASASISSSVSADLQANAHIGSRVDNVGQTNTGTTSASASVSSSQLRDVEHWPAENSSASTFNGMTLVDFASWPN